MAAVAPAVSNAPVVTLYWLEQSRSQRILWLLEELKVPYKLELFKRDPKTHLAKADLIKVHPLGKSPVVSISAPNLDKPILLAESAFLTEYLIEHFGKNTNLAPTQWKKGQEGQLGGETEEWLRYRYYMHYNEGSLMTIMMMKSVGLGIKNAPVPFFVKPITSIVAGRIDAEFLDANFERHFSFLNEQLKTAPGGGPYLCGPHLTGPDILMSFPLLAARGRIGSLTAKNFPRLFEYIDLLEQAPGYKKAVEKIVELEGSFSVIFD